MTSSKIDFTYFVLRANLLKRKLAMGNRKVTDVHSPEFIVEQVIPLLLECLSDVSEYPKARILKSSKIPLIPILIKHLTHTDLITVLSKIKHFHVKGKARHHWWCCSLHRLVANYIAPSIFDSLFNVYDDKILLKFLFIYEGKMSGEQKLKLIIKLDESGRLNRHFIKAILPQRVSLDRLTFETQLVKDILNRLQDRPELFIATFGRLPYTPKKNLKLFSDFSSVETKWKWFLSEEGCIYEKENFESITLSLAFGNSVVPGGVEPAHHYFSAYLKNVETLPKKYWSRAMNAFFCFHYGKQFDLESAKLLYESDAAKRILIVILRNGIIPYYRFNYEYVKYGVENGVLQYFKYNPKLSADTQLVSFSQLYNSLKPYYSRDDINAMLKGCITRDFIPQYLRKRKRSYCGDIFFCSFPNDSLRISDWKELCFRGFKTGKFGCYFSSVIKQRSIAEAKQLMEGMKMIENAQDRTIENIVGFYWKDYDNRSLECLMRVVFNPEIISAKFRTYLWLENSISSYGFKMKLDLKNCQGYGIGSGEGSSTSCDVNEIQKRIDKIIMEGEETKSRWKCMLQAYPGDLIRNLKFWEYLSKDFYDEVRKKNPGQKFFRTLEKQEGKRALILLHTIMNTYFDSNRLHFNGQYEVNSTYFWSKILSL